jgi:hypothetical protein
LLVGIVHQDQRVAVIAVENTHISHGKNLAANG